MGTSIGELTALEVYLVDCARDGEVFSLSGFAAKGGDTKGTPTVRAKVIESLLRGQPLPGGSHAPSLSGFGLRIRNTGTAPADPDGNKVTKWLRRFFKLQKASPPKDQLEPVDRVIVDETLDLSGITTKLPIELVGCELKGGLSLEDAEIRSLDLKDSKLEHFRARDLKVHGSLLARGAFQCVGAFDIRNAWIDGDVRISGKPGEKSDETSVDSTIGSLSAGTAVIKGDLSFSNCTIPGGVGIIGIEVQGDLDGEGAILGVEEKRNGGGGIALIVQNATIGGRVLLRSVRASNRFTAFGMLDFLGATIGGAVDFSGAKIVNADEVALNFTNSEIGNNLRLTQSRGLNPPEKSKHKSRFRQWLQNLKMVKWFRHDTEWSERLEVTGSISLRATEIKGDLQFWGMTVNAPIGKLAIDASAIDVGGNIQFLGNSSNEVRFVGGSRFLNGNVGGTFQIGSNDGPHNIFHGPLILTGANIGSDLILQNLICTHGLFANGVTAKQSFYFGPAFRVYGTAHFENAEAGEDLRLPLTDYHRDQKRSTRNLMQGFWWGVVLACSRVLRDASDKSLARYNTHREKVAPRRLTIDLTGAVAKTFKVNTRLGLRSIKLVLDEFQYDSIRFAEHTWLRGSRLPGLIEVPYHYISSTGLIWMLMWIPRFLYGKIDRLPKHLWTMKATKSLRKTLAGFPPFSWATKNFKEFIAPGIDYRQAGTTDAKALLRRLHHKNSKFSRQTYDHLIGRLKHGGHEQTPRKIEWMKQERLRREVGPSVSGLQLRWPKHPMRWLYLTLLNLVAGHGLKISRPTVLALVSLSIGWWAFACAGKLEIMKPIDSSTMVQIARGELDEEPSQYPDFVPSVYALDVFFPLIDLYQERYWFPEPPTPEAPLNCTQSVQGPTDDRDAKCDETLDLWVYRLTVWTLEITDQEALIPAARIAYLTAVEVVVGRHIMLVRYLLPILGWLLTSIMIAILATRFRDVTGLARA